MAGKGKGPQGISFQRKLAAVWGRGGLCVRRFNEGAGGGEGVECVRGSEGEGRTLHTL